MGAWLHTRDLTGPLEHQEGYLVYLDSPPTGFRKAWVLLSAEQVEVVPPNQRRLNDLQKWHLLIGVSQAIHKGENSDALRGSSQDNQAQARQQLAV